MKLRKVLNYFKKPKNILLYLMYKGWFNFLTDKNHLKLEYKMIMNKKLNLDEPNTFNEKLQWLKLYDRNPEYTKMVDKYEAKKYVSDLIGEEHIIPTLGIYNNFEEINFDKLPNQFVIKPTHTSGNIFICKNKNKINYKELNKSINKWLKIKYYYLHREWPYKNIKPRIIIEKYMATEKQPELIDYKFFCFNGKPKFIYVSEGLSNHKTAKISFADMNYQKTEFYRKDYIPFQELPPKPRNFEKMKEIAKTLSKNICFVRVDFYEINDKIYFSELTFFPCSGFIPFEPEKYDKILGDMLELPKEKREEK